MKGEKTMLNLIDYKNEIIAIAKANDAAWDVARDMFLANVRNAGQDTLPYYDGADGVDWEALHAECPDIGTQEYADMCNKFKAAFRAELEGGEDA
jgi:hypothetical protein